MKRLSRFELLGIPTAVLGSCLLFLSACNSEPDPEPVAAPKPSPKMAALKAADETSTFARAVGDGKPGAAVTIRYEFSGKPSVGAPTELDVAFIPNAGVDSMEVKLTGMEGITLAGPVQASFSAVEPGKAYRHKVSVLPDRTGVFYITASVTTQIAGSSLGRTFAIPFVVGEVPAQSKPAPSRDEKGEAIHPMKAQETKH